MEEVAQVIGLKLEFQSQLQLLKSIKAILRAAFWQSEVDRIDCYSRKMIGDEDSHARKI